MNLQRGAKDTTEYRRQNARKVAACVLSEPSLMGDPRRFLRNPHYRFWPLLDHPQLQNPRGAQNELLSPRLESFRGNHRSLKRMIDLAIDGELDPVFYRLARIRA